MKTIKRPSDNMGGVIRMWAIPPRSISMSGKTVTIISDANVIDITVKEDSAGFTEEASDTFAGTFFKTDITATIPCDTDETLAIIKEMERKMKYLVIYMDGNENYKLAGSNNVPLRFSAKASTGTTAAALNNYNITFTGSQRERAVFIDNPF